MQQNINQQETIAILKCPVKECTTVYEERFGCLFEHFRIKHKELNIFDYLQLIREQKFIFQIENKLVQKNSVKHEKLEKYKKFLDGLNQFDDLNCSVQAVLSESLDQSINSTICSQLKNWCYFSLDCKNEEQNKEKKGNQEQEEKENKEEEEKKNDENRQINTNGKKNKEKDIKKKNEQILKCPVKGCDKQYKRPNYIFNHFNKKHQKDSIMKYLKDLESQNYLMMADFKINYNKRIIIGQNNENLMNLQNNLSQSLDQSLDSTNASLNFTDIQQSNESTAQWV